MHNRKKQLNDVLNFAYTMAANSGVKILDLPNDPNDSGNVAQQIALKQLRESIILEHNEDDSAEDAAAQFIRYMDAVMELSAAEGKEHILYNKSWKITFGSMSVELPNCAAIYNAVYDGIKEAFDIE